MEEMARSFLSVDSFISVFMNILVTGIHGFVGSNLVLSLKEKLFFMGWILFLLKKRGYKDLFVG